jgi:hypothetical protein
MAASSILSLLPQPPNSAPYGHSTSSAVKNKRTIGQLPENDEG